MTGKPCLGKRTVALRVRRTLGIVTAAAFFRLHGVSYGRAPFVFGRPPRLLVRGTLRVGDYCAIRSLATRATLSVGPGGTLTLGDHVFVNQGAHVHASQSVYIGDHTQIGPRVAIYDTHFHEVAPGTGIKAEPISIGRNVWIGHGAIILPGCEVGDHSVIGAGSIVVTDVPSRAVVGGNPARVLRYFACSDDYVR